jgi:hypothetical protein
MTKQRVVAAAIGLGFLAIICVGTFLQPKRAAVKLVNESHELVVHVAGDINGAKFEFADIPPGATRFVRYAVLPDNHFTISADFPLDRKIQPETGIFSDRVKTTHRFVIKPDEIVVESGEE